MIVHPYSRSKTEHGRDWKPFISIGFSIAPSGMAFVTSANTRIWKGQLLVGSFKNFNILEALRTVREIKYLQEKN